VREIEEIKAASSAEPGATTEAPERYQKSLEKRAYLTGEKRNDNP